MMGSLTAPDDGWKPGKRYQTKVLVGNWLEDRLNWENYRYPISSTTRMDYKDYGVQRPDKLLRLKEKVRLEKGSSDVIMKPKMTRSEPEKPGTAGASCNYPYMVTWYDEDYNRKPRSVDQKLPKLRNWNLQHIAWVPEKSDHPICHPPTNWGLTRQKTESWISQLNSEGKAPKYDTTYSTSYYDCDVRSAAESRRFAIPRDLSVHFVPNNRIRLLTRGQRGSAPLQIPEPPLCNIAEQIHATHCRIQEQGRQLQENLTQHEHDPQFPAVPPRCLQTR